MSTRKIGGSAGKKNGRGSKTRKRKTPTQLSTRKFKEAKDFPVRKGVIQTNKDGDSCATKIVTDTIARKYAGYDISKKMKTKHTIIRKEIVLYDCDTNEIVLAYSPKYFKTTKIDNAIADLEKHAPLSGFRGEAAGKADLVNIQRNIRGKKGLRFESSETASWANIYRPTGSKISLSNFVMSGNIGNYKRKRLNNVRESSPITDGTQDLIDESVRFLKDKVPSLYKQMYAAIKDSYRYGGDDSPFTTITINKNFRTAMHRDKGNLNGYAVLTASHIGKKFRGGLLHFPQYGIAVPLRKGDALVANVNLLHGNDMITYPKGSSRISFVLYSRVDFKA
jgi:hypothetical protein